MRGKICVGKDAHLVSELCRTLEFRNKCLGLRVDKSQIDMFLQCVGLLHLIKLLPAG